MNMKQLLLHKVLEEAAEAATRVEKIEVLQKYNSLALRDFLRGSFDESIQWNLPKGEPPFEPFDLDNKQRQRPMYMHKQTQKLKYFVVGGPGDNMMQPKRERLFIELLETIHPEDAKLLCYMKDKEMDGKYKGITKALVEKAFPGLIRK